MSIRTWQAAQSEQIELDGELWPVVTQEDLVAAVCDGVVAMDRLGGCLGVVLQRIPTGVPDEMVTTRAFVTWRDRTDAKAQPEASVVAEAIPLPEVDPEGALAELTAEPELDTIGDGLVVDREGVDESDPELQAALGG